MPYNQDKTYADAPRFWTFQDCYFARNREDELYRIRGITGDVLYDRCVFEDCSINENEGFGAIFSFEGRHRSWFVKIAVTNSIIANCKPDGGTTNNHLFSLFSGSGCGGQGNLAMPNPEIHIVNNTIFNTQSLGPTNKIINVNYCIGDDPEMAAPDQTPWPDDGDGFGMPGLPIRHPEIIIANNIIYGSDTAPLGNAFGSGIPSDPGFTSQSFTDVNLINNNLFGLADATTADAHSEVGTMSLNPIFVSTVLTPPANPGEVLPGTPFLPLNTSLTDAGDDAAYAASGAGASDIDGDLRPSGLVDVGAQELGTTQEISGVENWELMDWDTF